MLRQVLQNKFAKSIALLTGGTAFAQLIGVLALPMLTRLYSPADFGVLGAFTALVSIISVVATLRYHVAIPLAKNEREALSLVVLSLLSVLVIGIGLIIGLYFFGLNITERFDYNVIDEVLWLLPIGVILTGAYTSFQYWATREKAYKKIAKTKLIQGVGGVLAQITVGISGGGAHGLVLGQMISNGAGFVGLSQSAVNKIKKIGRRLNLAYLLSIAYRYRRFPLYSSGESLANIAGLQVSLIVISAINGEAGLGFLMLAMRILQAPMSLIGSAVAQVYYGYAAEKRRSGEFQSFTMKILRQLFRIGLMPIVLAGLLGPWAVPKIFGSEWAEAGTLLVWLAPYFFLQFLSSPLSMSLHIMNMQRLAFALQIFGFFLRVGSVVVFSSSAVIAFAVSSGVFYLIYLIVIVMMVRSK